MNDEQGSFYLLPSLPTQDNSSNNERDDMKNSLERVESPHNSFVQRLLSTTPNENNGEKLAVSCQSPSSPHSSAVADGTAHLRENLSESNILSETARTQGPSTGDQWIHSQLEDYMVYQGLTFTNGALGDSALSAGGRVNQMSNETAKVENGSSNSSAICQLCGKSYSNKAHLMRHMQSHTNLRPYKCDLCHLAFRNTSRLKRHKETHSGVKPYKCPLCEAKVSRKEHLKRHMIIHTDSRPYKCSLCPFSAKRIDSIKHHIRQRHVEGMATVTTLHFGQSVVHNLLGHLQQSSSNQPHAMPSSSNNQQNPTRPPGSKKKKKKANNNAANNGMSLSSVMPPTQSNPSQQHDELLGLILNNSAPVEGLLPCDMCSKSFTDQAKLNRHKFSHLAVKPFICDICGARLSRQDHLKRHMYMHESSHPLICGSCRYATNKLSDLRVHIKNQHPGERIRILSSLSNSRSGTDGARLSGMSSSSPDKRDGSNSMVATGDNPTSMSLTDTMVLPQGESIYSAGTWCPSTGDNNSCSNEAAGQPMSKRKRKNPQKCQVTMEGALKASEAGLVSSPAKDIGSSAGAEQSLRVPVPPSAPLMVPSYNLMHNAQYNLAGQAWKQPNTLTNLNMNYVPQAENSNAHFAESSRGSRGGGVMDLRQTGQFENGQDEHVKHGHCSGKSVKNEKLHDVHMDNRRSSPIINVDGGSMHQLAVSSRLLSDASLRSGLPRMNEVWGAHFVDKTGWLRMPNAQGFTAPFFNNGMPNFVFNWPLQQGLPISSAAKTGNNAVEKLEANRNSDAIVAGPSVYNAYDLADLSSQPGGFFGQGWPPGMNPY